MYQFYQKSNQRVNDMRSHSAGRLSGNFTRSYGKLAYSAVYEKYNKTDVLLRYRQIRQ